jgi:aspartokinase-like uncharacterized kinase
MSSKLLIKVGGSLCDPRFLPPIAMEIQRLATSFDVIIVPGGGPFADLVRTWESQLALSESTAHWMAIAAMDQYGLLLESLGVGRAVEEFHSLSGCNGASVFLP